MPSAWIYQANCLAKASHETFSGAPRLSIRLFLLLIFLVKNSGKDGQIVSAVHHCRGGGGARAIASPTEGNTSQPDQRHLPRRPRKLRRMRKRKCYCIGNSLGGLSKNAKMKMRTADKATPARNAISSCKGFVDSSRVTT